MEEDRYVIAQCPFGCGSRLRFPRVPYSLQVTCPRCKQTFTWTPFGMVWDERFHVARRNRLSLLAGQVRKKRKWVGIALLLLLVLTGLSVLTENAQQEVSSSLPHSPNKDVSAQKSSPAPDGPKQSLSQGTGGSVPVAKSPIVSVERGQRLPPRAERILPPTKLIPPPDEHEQRLPNGAYLDPRRLTQGHSTLLVENGTPWDAVVKLVKQEVESKITTRFVYVRHGESVLLTDIEPGDYILAWCCGTDWDAVSMQFNQPAGCSVAKETFTFTESVTHDFEGTHIRFTKARVTLHAVVGGNIGRNSISQEEFQSL